MSFDPIHIYCSGCIDWPAAILIALLFAPPTVLLALRHCAATESARARMAIGAFALLGMSLSAMLTWMGALPQPLVVGMLFAGLAASAGALGVQVYRRCVVRR